MPLAAADTQLLPRPSAIMVCQSNKDLAMHLLFSDARAVPGQADPCVVTTGKCSNASVQHLQAFRWGPSGAHHYISAHADRLVCLWEDDGEHRHPANLPAVSTALHSSLLARGKHWRAAATALSCHLQQLLASAHAQFACWLMLAWHAVPARTCHR